MHYLPALGSVSPSLGSVSPSPETLEALGARLKLLREMGVYEHDPQSGRVVFFPPRVAAASVSDGERERVELDRQLAEVATAARRSFGAAGGFQPGAVDPARLEALEREKEAVRMHKVRAAREKLDAELGATK